MDGGGVGRGYILLIGRACCPPILPAPTGSPTCRASENFLQGWLIKTRKDTRRFVHSMIVCDPAHAAEALQGHKKLLQPGLEVLRFMVDCVVYR